MQHVQRSTPAQALGCLTKENAALVMNLWLVERTDVRQVKRN